MNTINLETEIVATRNDPTHHMSYYTIARGGRRWTIGIPDDDLAQHKSNKVARRLHLAQTLTVAMQGKADGEL